MGDSGWPPIAAQTRQIRATLANNVRHERQRAGMSQSALARASSVRRETIARVEAAEQEPRISTLVAFAVALRVPLHVFLVGLPDPGVVCPPQERL